MKELKEKLSALGLSEEMTEKVIATVVVFAKAKLPSALHTMVDEVAAGKTPDLSRAASLLGGLKGLFGGR